MDFLHQENYGKFMKKWAKENNIHIISVSLPGWGLSDPIEPLNINEWAENDIYTLMTSLNFSKDNKFHLLSASMGTKFASAIASCEKTKEMVANVMLYVPFYPKTKSHDPLEGSIMITPLKIIPMIDYMFSRLFLYPLLRMFMNGDAERSIKYQTSGFMEGSDVISSNWDFDWKSMGEGREVYIVIGKNDEIAPNKNGKLLNQEIKSKLIEYDGKHIDGIEKPELMQSHMKLLFDKK